MKERTVRLRMKMMLNAWEVEELGWGWQAVVSLGEAGRSFSSSSSSSALLLEL